MADGVTEAAVLAALKQVRDPDLGTDIVSLGFVKDVQIRGGDVALEIELTTPACPVKDQMKEEARRFVLAVPGVKNAAIRMSARVRPAVTGGTAPIREIKNVVPVASGKGGVGKSTMSANLALALAESGAKVGLLDADVYGPSIPAMMGVKTPPENRGGRLVPPVQYGIKIMSTGFFLPENDAAIVRGPILHKMVEQFLTAVEWGELDYLVVDLPPGTGDIQLSLCQIIPLTGAVIVSTPQETALRVAQKAIAMFQKLRCPILGMIENMSYHVCSGCGVRDDLFGSGGVRRAAERLNIPFLGEIPLAKSIRVAADEGRPEIIARPDSEFSKAFRRAAENLAARISVRGMAADRAPGMKITF